MAKAKRFRIATEGATTDGRTIERNWLEQMAKNYDPKTYGARVNLEHIKGITPDSPFKRYGDVLALSTETVDNKLALFAVIDPTEELVALSKSRQKVYTSMEVNTAFADTGEAYLVGLAVTDDPASLGTEMLTFSASAQHSPLAKRKAAPSNLFSEAVEFTLELEDDTGPSLFARVKELLSGKGKSDDARFNDQAAAIEALAASQRELIEQFAQITTLPMQMQTLSAEQAALSEDHAALVQKLSREPVGRARSVATGGDGDITTDC